MKKRFFLLMVWVLISSGTLIAQETSSDTNAQQRYQKGLGLSVRKLYQPAQLIFRETMNNGNDKTIRTQSEYYVATIAAILGQKGAETLVNKFITSHPESPLSADAYLQMANLYYEQGNYTEALEWYASVDPLRLNSAEKEKLNFQKGYALFTLDKQSESRSHFEAVQNSSTYGNDAKYYLGYMAYDADDYQKAEKLFGELSASDSDKNVSYFQANMYFSQALYDDAIEEGEKQLAKTKNAQEISELHKIVGESYFNLKKYQEALPHLMLYKGKKGKLSNTDYYYMGYALYKNNDYEGAISQFNKIIDGNDEVAQNAYYHLAECYLKTNKKQEALNAFRNASQMAFDEQIKKDAYLNYARLSYEIGNVYEAVPSVLMGYAKAYPKDNKEEIQSLLVDSYISSGNYEAAISILEKSTDAKDKELYKKVAFYRGAELFNDQQYTEALKYLERAITDDSTISARAAYWAGESAYELKNFSKATTFFDKFLANPSATKTDEYSKVYYSLAYSYFNQQQYANAIANFESYLKQNPKDEAWKQDAMLRLADSYFVTGKYWPAMEGYNKLIEAKTENQDYAAYQKAISYGFVDRANNKIEELEKFIKNYPDSNLRPNALYELGSTYVTQGNMSKGMEYYEQLSTNYKGNVLVPRVLLRQGLVYYSRGEEQKALQLFKTIAKDYPNTNEASQAVASAKLIYVDMGQVNEYAAWAKSLGYVEVTNLELEAATYESAERQYLQNNLDEAIAGFEKYIKQYPNGMRRTNAEFYLAQSYFNKGNKANALTYFEKVYKSSSNDFSEQSLVRVCQILLDAGSYLKAKPYLEELEKRATISQNRTFARSNLMRVCYNENLYDKANEYANKVLADKQIDARVKADAYVVLARTYFKKGDDAQARKYYKEVEKTGTENKSVAAEALYYDAYYKNKDKDYKASNEVVQRIAKDYGAQKEYAAKSLIVMAKNFYGQKDSYQATYVLESVAKSFKDMPEIVAEAKKELAAIKAETAKTNSSVKQ